MVISLLVGVFLGWLMELLYHELPENRSRFMVAGLIGAWIGNYFWFKLGPAIYGFAPIPSFLGAGLFLGLAWLLVNLTVSSKQ